MSETPRTESFATPERLLPRLDLAGLEWSAGIRASLCILLPLLTLLWLDRLDLTIYASFAAFTSLYGRSETYGSRAASVATAASMVYCAMAAGIGIQAAGSPPWLVVAGFVAVTWLGTAVSRAMHLIPRGAIFVVFAYLGCLAQPLPETGAGDALLTAAIVCVFGFLISLAGALLRLIPALRRRLPPLARVPQRRASAAWDADTTWVVLATIFASGIAWGLVSLTEAAGHQYWTIVTVVAIFSGPYALTSYTRTSHRVVGTLAGIGVSAALFGTDPSPLQVIIVITLCQLATEATVALHYGVALGFITPIALGATNITGRQDWAVLFTDRARETMIGGAVCLVFIFFVRLWLWRREESRATDDPLSGPGSRRPPEYTTR